MEQDINLIIDVSQHEAKLLIEVVEMMLEDWYIRRHEREEKLRSIKEVAAEKTEKRKR